jgi:hypothetical protein
MMAKAPLGYNQCITAVSTAAGRELSEAELERIFNQLQGKVRRYMAGGMPETDAYVRAGGELGTEMKLAAAIEKRNKLMNVAARRVIEGKIGNSREAAALRNILRETDARQAGLLGQLMAPLVDDLETAGLTRVLASRDAGFERAVWRELGAVQAGKPAVTKNPLARTAAEIITKHQERARVMQNEAGAWIAKREDYLTRQMHDQDLIRDAGFDKWRDFILPRLDVRTFDDLADTSPEAINAYMKRVYNALASGVHDRPNGRVAWGDVGAGTGPGNLARRVSADRELIFKDADARADYQQEFARGSIMNIVEQTISSASRNAALMQMWGPNPEAMHDMVRKQAMKRASDRGDTDEVKRLQRGMDNKIMQALTGALSADARQPVPGMGWLGNMTFGQLSAGATALQTMTKLGGVVLSSFPDLASNAAVLRHNGVPIFESYGNQLRALLPDKGRRETALLSGVGIDTTMQNVASRVHAMDVGSGRVAWMVDKFHKLNLLSWWTNSLKEGAATILSHNMGRLAGQTFGDLPPMLQATMGRYGITAKDWDVARGFAGKAADGKEHVLPAHIDDMQVATKFYTYINDQVRDAMNEPDAYTRAFVTGGTQMGTPEGTAMRILMQFKTYPVTFMHRVYLREVADARAATGRMDVAGVAHLIVASTLLGYAAMEMKQAARLREPRTANADSAGDVAKIAFAALQQGGGFGIYGDFLFGQANRMGAGPVASLFGPTVGSADAMIEQWQNFRRMTFEGDSRAGRDLRSGLLGFARDHTPFVNMFYTRAAMDYLIWYRLQEAFNPGYLSRYEDRMRRENDTTFMLSPTWSAPR